MTEFKDYANNAVLINSHCPACAYINHEFQLPCGMAYEDEICMVSQDWQLPINGMMIVATKRHVELFEEITEQEKTHIFKIVNNVILIMRKHKIAKHFNVIFEEKKGSHFHIWILPRDGWKEIGIDPTKDVRLLQNYALNNLKTKENFEKIKNTSMLINEELTKLKLN